MLKSMSWDDTKESACSTNTSQGAAHIGRVEAYVQAISSIELSSCERDMLRAHAMASGHEITGLTLAHTVGHFGSRIGNKKYGRLAAKIATAANLPMCKTDVSDYLAAIFTLADGKQSEGEDWTWVMHDNVVRAVKQLGMV